MRLAFALSCKNSKPAYFKYILNVCFDRDKIAHIYVILIKMLSEPETFKFSPDLTSANVVCKQVAKLSKIMIKILHCNAVINLSSW